MEVKRIDRLSIDALQPPLEASTAEGYTFVQRLWDEYDSGVNRFDDTGAALMGIFADGAIIAVGGIHTDPYLNNPTTGRIRHVYVLPAYRRSGAGKMLVLQLLRYATGHYETVTLRTLTDHGHAFYTALGFSDVPRFANATHWIDLTEQDITK